MRSLSVHMLSWMLARLKLHRLGGVQVWAFRRAALALVLLC